MYDMRCFSYSFPCSLDRQQLLSYLRKNFKIKIYDNVFHLIVEHKSVAKGEGDVFIFDFGALVTWGLTEKLEQDWVRILDKYPKELLGAIDDEITSYSYAQQAASIVEDHITLPDNHILNKLACSHALAQSVKLGGFEESIQKVYEQTKHLPEELAKFGKIKLSKRNTQKLMGKIFVARTSINLHLELLDKPNFFWENTEYEYLHEIIAEYMEQERRLQFLNQRLAVMQELLDILSNELNNIHSSHLEWIIIILIFIEVTMMFAREILHVV